MIDEEDSDDIDFGSRTSEAIRAVKAVGKVTKHVMESSGGEESSSGEDSGVSVDVSNSVSGGDSGGDSGLFTGDDACFPRGTLITTHPITHKVSLTQ